MILNPIRAVRCWRMKRDLDLRLAVRKEGRSRRSQAAHKGWQTRRQA